MDLRRGPCDIPSGRVEYRKAVLTSKWYLLSVEADWREATAGALAAAGGLRRRSSSTGQCRPNGSEPRVIECKGGVAKELEAVSSFGRRKVTALACGHDR